MASIMRFPMVRSEGRPGKDIESITAKIAVFQRRSYVARRWATRMSAKDRAAGLIVFPLAKSTFHFHRAQIPVRQTHYELVGLELRSRTVLARSCNPQLLDGTRCRPAIEGHSKPILDSD